MKNIGPIFMRANGYRQKLSGGPWWMSMVPGVIIVLFALFALFNPLMLARLFGYVVGFALLASGGSLVLQGWRMRELQIKSGGNLKQHQDDDVIYYDSDK